MSWDNQALEINGHSQEMLRQALNIAFDQGHHTATFWRVERPHGLILLWAKSTSIPANEILGDTSADAITPIVWDWLQNEILDHSHEYEFMNEDGFDGTIDNGWHLSRGNGDFVGDNFYRICMIRPERLWYGK